MKQLKDMKRTLQILCNIMSKARKWKFWRCIQVQRFWSKSSELERVSRKGAKEEMNEILFSSKNEEWETPQDLFNELNKEFNFTVDVASSNNNYKLKKYYTVKEDGLLQDWANEIVWCNPPYGRKIENWVKKASESKAMVVMLIPVRTDTKWFHKYIYEKKNVEIRFIKGRLKFGNSKNSAPFPSMIVIFRGGTDESSNK